MPVVFSEVDKRALFFANNHLWKTVDGGAELAADQSRSDAEDVGHAEERRQVRIAARSRSRTQRGVIYTIAPSYQDINRIWVGTDDGLIHVTADSGKTWTDVTPPALTPLGEGLVDRCRTLQSRRPPTPRSIRCGSTICVRTSCARTTAARPGRRSSTAFRPEKR